MFKWGLYIGFMAFVLLAVKSLQPIISGDMLDFLAILSFIMVAIFFVAILDKFFIKIIGDRK